MTRRIVHRRLRNTLRTGKLSLLLLFLIAISPTAHADKYALVIGISAYSHRGDIQNLKYADDDAEEMSRVLDAAGYEVYPLLNNDATRYRILEKFRDYSDLNENDEFLLYFSGHGVRDTAVNNAAFWMTHDANPNMLDHHGIRLHHLMDYVNDIGAGRKLVLLDHCYSGDVEFERKPVAEIDTTGGARNTDTSLGKITSKEGVAVPEILTSQLAAEGYGFAVIAAARNLAFETEELKHGVFTQALLSAFQSRNADTIGTPDGQLSLEELSAFLKTEVPRLSAENNAPNQEIRVGLRFDDPASWILSDQLAFLNPAAVEVFEAQIKAWAQAGKVDGKTRGRAISALKVLADPASLSGESAAVVQGWVNLGRNIREIMADTMLLDSMKISEVTALVEEFGTG